MRLIIFVWVAFAFGLGSCSPRHTVQWPFPPVDAENSDAVLQTISERNVGLGTVYAELQLVYERRERGGVVSVVVLYDGEQRLRLKAFRDVTLGSRDIFDLLVVGERFEMVLPSNEAGDSVKVKKGKIRELAQDHPALFGFVVLRESFFLPGPAPDRGSPRVIRSDETWLVEERLLGNTFVQWELDEATLGTKVAALLTAANSAPWARIEYRSYRQVGAHYFPERFVFSCPLEGVVIEGFLQELETGIEFDDGDFTVLLP